MGMPQFADLADYQGVQVHFLKRAQLAAADLALAFNEQGLGHFLDLDRLTIFADNVVPHVLRMDGILHYSRALSERIDHGIPIAASSEEEIEIRACAVHAAELIVDELTGLGRRITARDLDYCLWNRGHLPTYRSHPTHITRSLFY
jgi:hypothetical protein